MVERCDFDLQVTRQADGQSQRPDMRVNLAEGKHVFVDSKVPLSAFLDAAETDDEQPKAAHLATFARHVRTHVDQLSSKKYWKAAESPEFVVLFLPSEVFFAAALEQMPDLYEYAIKRDVVLATPTTLIGMLRAVAYGWKQAALAETAAEVFRLGRELHERLGRMGNRFDKLGRAIRTSVNAYNETVGHGRGHGARPGAALPRPPGHRARPRAARQRRRRGPADPGAELVDDAVQVEPIVGRAPRAGDAELPRRRRSGGRPRRRRAGRGRRTRDDRRAPVARPSLGPWPSETPTPTPVSWAASPSPWPRCSPTWSTRGPRAGCSTSAAARGS